MQDTLGKRIGRTCLYVLGSLLALAAVFLFCKPRSEYVLQKISLETEGLPATAIVIAKSTGLEDDHHSRVRRGSGRSNGVVSAARLVVATDRAVQEASNPRPTTESYYVDYVFHTHGLELTEGTLQVSASDFRKLKIGAALPAIYHPINPSVSRLIDYSKATADDGAAGELFLAAMTALSALYFLGYGWRLSCRVVKPSDSAGDSRQNAMLEAVARAAAVKAKPIGGTHAARPSSPVRRQPGFGQRARA